MHVLVLGAGVIGVTSAWFLRQAGHQVTVIERQPQAAMETSFANGGQISVSQAEPWASPDAMHKIIKWLGKEDAPLLFRLRTDPRQWLWGLRFLRECTNSRHARNLGHLVNLGLYSRATLQQLRTSLALEYDQQSRGILQIHTDERDFRSALAAARLMNDIGCERNVLDIDQVCQLEPALAVSRRQLLGAIYSPADESGDAHRFTQALAAHALAAGVEFLHQTEILRIVHQHDRISSVTVRHADGTTATLSGDTYVVALGSYSPLLLAPLGIRLQIYPAKGYSITLPVEDRHQAPRISITDEAHKLVFSRFGNRLRVAGTAELAGYDTHINPQRCEAIVRRTFQLFPNAGLRSAALSWSGLRPATPSNIPYIGRKRYRNLYLNTGHGTLGWTQSCGSAAALAQLISGKRPEVDFPFVEG